MRLDGEIVVILGCGYTGKYVARRMLAGGARVIVTTRHPETLEPAGVEVVRFEAVADPDLSFIPPGARVLYSIPTLDPDPTPNIVHTLGARQPVRLVYLSTTGVYGASREVDENTAPAPRFRSEIARVKAEDAVLAGPWSSLVLRPAAIYGPGRGVHVKMRAGTFQLAGDGSKYVSRIHVEDLAALIDAALFAGVSGAWPVADDEPCRSADIAAFCSALLGVPMPPSVDPSQLHTTRRADRRVNGEAIRRILGIELRYPSYREGIPASDLS